MLELAIRGSKAYYGWILALLAVAALLTVGGLRALDHRDIS